MAWTAAIFLSLLLAPASSQKATPSSPPSSAQPATTQTLSDAAKPASNTGQKDSVESRPAVPRWFVLIDPGHGGPDAGAKLSDKLPEKDFNLQFARKLRAELQSKGISAQLLRDNDSGANYEQRSASVNTQHAGLYIGIHSTLSGAGVKIYSVPAVASNPFPTKEEEEKEKQRGPFVLWDTAQQSRISRSHALALEIAEQLRQHEIAESNLTAAMRPLASLSMPAVVIEISPPGPGSTVEKLTANAYLQSIVQATATAIASLVNRTEDAR